MSRFFASDHRLRQTELPASTPPMQERSSVVELERLVARQGLMIETLSRLLIAKGVVQEPELDQWMQYVDELDGKVDGKLKVRKSPTICPSCNRANPASLVKCMYCAKEFPQKFLADPADDSDDKTPSRR